MTKNFSRSRPDSFSLVEMLVVVAIMAILAFLSIPSVLGVLRSSRLSTGGNLVVDQLNLSRQLAMTKNCQVEFRFYQLPDANTSASGTPGIYRAVQAFSLDHDGTQTNAITKVTYLPSQIYLATNSVASTLLAPGNPPFAVAGSAAGATLGTYPPSSYNYIDFHFRSDGSTDLNPATAQLWYVSLANQGDKISGAASLPMNFITIQLDARTGIVRVFRPN